jgi:hypothetical protein
VGRLGGGVGLRVGVGDGLRAKVVGVGLELRVGMGDGLRVFVMGDVVGPEGEGEIFVTWSLYISVLSMFGA